MDQPWYIELFDEHYLRTYSIALTHELTINEVDFIVEKLALHPGAQILDLCCGHGRHSIELAHRGYTVTGLDLSEPSLARARLDAEAAGVAVRWIQSYMRQIPFENEFEACINWFTAFGYLESDEEDQNVLAAVQRALRPGGKFFIDTINHAWLMSNYAPRGWSATPEGEVLLEERRFDALTGRNHVSVTYIGTDGERKQSGHNVRIYTLVELSKMLSKAGLTIRQGWGDTEGSTYSLTTRRMIVLAEKESVSG